MVLPFWSLGVLYGTCRSSNKIVRLDMEGYRSKLPKNHSRIAWFWTSSYDVSDRSSDENPARNSFKYGYDQHDPDTTSTTQIRPARPGYARTRPCMTRIRPCMTRTRPCMTRIRPARSGYDKHDPAPIRQARPGYDQVQHDPDTISTIRIRNFRIE
jgi:hypothetical protein